MCFVVYNKLSLQQRDGRVMELETENAILHLKLAQVCVNWDILQWEQD